MSGLPPDLPQRNPVNSSVTAMSVQSNLSAAGAASAIAVRVPGAGTAVGPPRQSGGYHSSPSDGGLNVGANHLSTPATAAPSPTFHGFRPAFQSGVAGTAVVGGASIPQTLHRSAPNITQAVAQPIYFRPLPPGHMGFARPAVPQPPPSNMLSSASVPFGGGRVPTASYRTYTPLIPRPAAIDSPRNDVGDVATPGQPTPAGGVTALATSGGFRGFSGGGGYFGQGQVKSPRIPPHHKELLPRPSSSLSPIAPTDSVSADSDMAPPITADAPSEVPAKWLAEAGAGSIEGASSPRADEESRAMASKIGSCDEHSSVTFVEVRAAGTQVVNDKNQKLPQHQHTSINKRTPRTLLPPGYLERCRGKVRRSSGAVPKGALYAALHSDNNSKRHSSSRDVMARWLLTEDQILGDIKCMMENLPKGVVIASSQKEKEDEKEVENKLMSDDDAVLDPRLTPSEKEWLKIARQEDIEDQGNRGVAENVDGVDEARGAEESAASARDKDATTNAVDATEETKKNQTSNESPSEGTVAVEGAATEAVSAPVEISTAAGIDAAVTSAGLAAESQAVEGRAALEGVQPEKRNAEEGTETVENKESEESEPPLAIPTRRELMELDAKRDALELKETMILERARERQRCLTKERAKGHAVIQFLTRLEREDRSRTNLLRAKRFFVLAMARVLEQRVSESDGLLEQVEILKGLKRVKGDHPPRSPNGECSSAAASQSESKQSESTPTKAKAKQAVTKGKGKARAAWHSRHLMDVDEEAECFGAVGRSSLPGEHAMATSSRRDCGSGCGFGEGDEKGEENASRNNALERSGGWGSGAALVGDAGLVDVHSVTEHAMVQCWGALSERLEAARKVVREAGVDTGDASAANAVAGTGAVGRGRGGKGKSRRANPMDADDFGDGGHGGQSSPSSDEDSDVSGTVRFQGPRSRRKKIARQAGAASVATGVPIRKRGRKAQGQGQGTVGSGAVQDAVERERLDWPSTIIPRTPYNVPLLVSCLSTYPDKVVAALYPTPEPRWCSNGNGESNKNQNKGGDTQEKMQPRQEADNAASFGSHGGETQAFGFKADLLPGFSREEKLRQTHLHDRAVFEQVESMTRMYAEAIKMLTEQRANSPKLKGAFKSERHQDEREIWRQELEDLQAAVARSMPPPPSDGTWKEDAWNDGVNSEDKTDAKSKRGAATAKVPRAQAEDSPPANSASHPTNPIKSAAANPASHPTNPIKSALAVPMTGKGGKDVAFASASAWPSTSASESSSASASVPACTSASPSISASTVDSMGARKGRPARGAAKPPSPGVGRRTSSRGNESKARG